MMKHQVKYSRRNLLKALGVGAALLPLLESDPADAACLVNGVKRLFILVWPNGMLSSVSAWATSGDTPDAWQLPAFQASLQPYKADLTLLNGIDYDFIADQPGSGERTGHACYPGMLTGAFYQALTSSTSADLAGGPSVDQYIGSTLRAAGYAGLTSLNLGVFVKSTGHLSWTAAGQAVIPDQDPYHVFNTYFAGQVGMDPNVVKRGVLDYAIKDLNRFMGVVGTADKQAIQRHLDYVRNLELQLAAPGMVAACAPPPFAMPPLQPTSTSNVAAVTKMQMDLSVAAFRADLTRVVVMQIGDQAGANLILTNLGFATGGPLASDPNTGDANGWEAIARQNGADKLTCDTWFQSQAAYMIGQLKSATDVSGKSLLDNAAFVALSNMQSGSGGVTGVPAVMAGSCGGYFRTGRSLTLTNTPNNQLLVSLCNAMGTPVSTFGEARYGGQLSVLKA
jgi:Protein of unknown function (DUF1552)